MTSHQASFVVRGSHLIMPIRFSDAFSILKNDPNHKDRESLEHTMCSDEECSYKYARDVIKGRWVLGEAAISESFLFSYCYARDVVKGRFVLGEAAISESFLFSYWYATNVLNNCIAPNSGWTSPRSPDGAAKVSFENRFELGEAAISKDAKYAELYAKHFMKGNWTPELAVMCPCWLYAYAKDVIKGRLPSTMHNKMLSFGMIDSSDKYVKKYLGAKKYCTLKGIRVTKQKRLKCKIQDRC